MMYLASIMTFDDSFSETPQDFNESSTYGDYTDFTLPNSTFNTSKFSYFLFSGSFWQNRPVSRYHNRYPNFFNNRLSGLYNDPLLPQQWTLVRHNVPNVWSQKGYTGKDWIFLPNFTVQTLQYKLFLKSHFH